MRAATLRAWLAGSLGLVAIFMLVGLTRTVRGDDIEDAKRAQKIAAEELEAKLRDRLAEADKLSKSSPKDAISLVESLRSQLSLDRNLREERKQEWTDLLSSRITSYRQISVRAVGGTAYEERMRIQQERNRQTEEKNADLKNLHNQMADLYRKGKYDEVGKLGQRMEEKYGRSATSLAAMKSSRAAGALSELNAIRDEKSVRYQRVYNELIRSSIPIEGEIEFPKDWKEKTKRRTKVDLTPKEQALLKALNTSVTIEIKDQPISAVIEEFEKRYGITIDVDRVGLEQAQLTPESNVSIKAKMTTLRSVLKKMLGDVGLTFTIRKEGLRVTTPQRAADDMVIRAYYIGDLVQMAGMQIDPFGYNQVAMAQNVAALINMIESVDPSSWESGGGKGSIRFVPTNMTLLIRQSTEAQFMMQGWLK